MKVHRTCDVWLPREGNTHTHAITADEEYVTFPLAIWRREYDLTVKAKRSGDVAELCKAEVHPAQVLDASKAATPADITNPADEKKEIYTNLSAQKTKALINDYKAKSKKLTIIDVRTMDEYKKSHLANSRLIDFFDSNFEDKIKNLDKTIPYLVHCQSGGRSMKAFKLMQSLGFERVYHLDGGMLAWKKLGKMIQE